MSVAGRAPTVEGGAPAATDLVETIRGAIIRGDFAPNQRLIEADLSTIFGASRTSIRTALFELANDGLVDRLPNRGSRVRSISLEDAIEILEVRIGVEGLCAAKAAENITEVEITEFRILRGAIILSVKSGDLLEYSRLNQLLDQRIRDLSHHRTAVQTLERLRAQSVRHQFRLSFASGRAAVSGPEHVAIIDAIVARNAELAEQATRDHLRSVIAALRELD
jgi:DNA-binding GntR family transcriptional regulator